MAAKFAGSFEFHSLIRIYAETRRQFIPWQYDIGLWFLESEAAPNLLYDNCVALLGAIDEDSPLKRAPCCRQYLRLTENL